MTGKIFVKPPFEGAVINQPDRDMRPLSADGEWVADTLLWRRMIINGDVVEATPPKAAPKPAAKE